MSEENNISPLGVSLEVSVFVCGALVMIYEIIGSRIVAPFLGTSTYIWTSLIGVILGALSLGYWIGGRAADRRPSVRVLASAIFAAGGLVSLTIFLKDVILQLVADAPVSIELRSLIAALLVFAPASVALGFVIPYASKLRILSLDQAGSTVGRLYALSTIGSIAGTFLAGFVLIPFVGSVRTLYLIAGTLFAVSFLLAGMSLSRSSVSVLLLFMLGVVSSEGGAYYLTKTNGLYDIDTEYSRIRVFNAIYPPNGREIKALATDPATLQSARYLDSDELVLAYTRFYHLAKFHTPEMRKVLMIGGAGYSFPKEFLQEYPTAEMDVVEIDPGMTAIAREHFELKDDPRLRIFHQDGRVFLNKASPASYDVVMMDAFSSLFTVPFQLTTIEAVRRIHDVLGEDGAVVFNIGSSLAGDSSLFLQAELATYRAVFPAVSVYKVDKSAPDSRLQNIIIVASKSADAVPQADENAKHGFLLSHLREVLVNADAPILTDDLAPVERYLSIAQALK